MTTGSSLNQAQFDNLCINTIRFLSVDAVEKAHTGHPGLPLAHFRLALERANSPKQNRTLDSRITRNRFLLAPELQQAAKSFVKSWNEWLTGIKSQSDALKRPNRKPEEMQRKCL